MENKQEVLIGMQEIITGLSQQAIGHEMQARIFISQGFNKLGEKYLSHAKEEREYVSKFIDRLLDLDFKIKNEAKKESPIYYDIVEFLKYDLETSVNGLYWLKNIVEKARDDYKSFNILSDYYQDEDEDKNWIQQQFDLIEKIGLQNWLSAQI